jgi:hypothetical protein
MKKEKELERKLPISNHLQSHLTLFLYKQLSSAHLLVEWHQFQKQRQSLSNRVHYQQ